METNRCSTGKNKVNRHLAKALFTLSLGCLPLSAQAQETPKPDPQKPDTGGPRRGDTRPVETFYLNNSSQANDSNEILIGLRNLLDPNDRMYLDPSQNAIMLRATPEDIELARKILTDLDRPRKSYRLTYTVTESDGGKRVGVQHFAFIIAAGGRTTLKNGSKVPIATGVLDPGGKQQNTQFTYIDVGLNIDASLDEYAGGAKLRSKVENSGVTEEKTALGAQDPIVRQSVLEGTSFVTTGKPLVLGAMDIPGSTRHLDVEVLMESLR